MKTVFGSVPVLLVVFSSVVTPQVARASQGAVVESVPAIEKIAVFPVLFKGERGIRIDDATATSLDETWWQVRDELTQTGRFVVASRAFLQKADAFQPRGTLSVGDAVILGRYVEADALMTLLLRDRALTVAVYSSQDGAAVWSQTVELHPSVLVREQIAKIARALVREFIAALPYQGVTVQDSLSQTAIYADGGKRFVRIGVGNAKVAAGDPVQWIRLQKASLEPLFQGGSKIQILAEGQVKETKDRDAIVELTRASESNSLRAGSLVALPLEQAKLAVAAKPRDSATSAAIVSLLATNAAIEPEAKQLERKNDDSGPFATTLSILGSLAVVLLLAF